MELFRLRVQLSTITMPYCGNDHSASATEGSDVRLYIKQPFCSSTSYTFVLTNGTAGSADYTTTDVIVTVPAGATTGTVSPTTADTIDEVDEFSIASGTASATVQYRHNNAPTVATITPASATEGCCVFNFTLSNPSAIDTSYTFVLTNGTAGCGLHHYRR
jgi:hypothetical protein